SYHIYCSSSTVRQYSSNAAHRSVNRGIGCNMHPASFSASTRLRRGFVSLPVPQHCGRGGNQQGCSLRQLKKQNEQNKRNEQKLNSPINDQGTLIGNSSVFTSVFIRIILSMLKVYTFRQECEYPERSYRESSMR